MRRATQTPTAKRAGACLASSRPRSLPHHHANHHRDLRLRSHPLHFASTALFPFPPPQSIKMQRLVPQPVVLTVSPQLASHREMAVRTYRQTYELRYSLEMSYHTLLECSFLIGTCNPQHRLVLLSFIIGLRNEVTDGKNPITSLA
jgi:hypothetical protein